MSKDDFFIGWAETPKSDRRFFLKAGLGLMAGTGAIAAGLAAFQNSVGKGTWRQGEVQEWRGIVTAQPYAMLRTNDLTGSPQTVLLSCLGKCGVAARIGTHEGESVVIKGSLIQRGEHAMIAVAETSNWIMKDTVTPNSDELKFPVAVGLGDATLVGEILDTKCWFGAMRPSEGKVHKACASLCIRGGLPPAFFVKDGAGKNALLIMTDNGQAHGDDLLPYVADPVQISGQIYKRGNLLFLDNPIRNIIRIT